MQGEISTTTRAVRLGALLACAVLVLSATPAVAKKKKKSKALGPVVTATAVGNTTTAGGQISTATANCPSGTVAMGGGWLAPFAPPNALAVDNSFRSSPGSWTVSAVDVGGTASVTAFAYCRRATNSISDLSATATVPSGALMTGTASAACPAGTQLIAGGFQTTRGPTLGQLAFPQANSSVATGIWTVRSVNNTNGAQTLTAHAYCMSGIKAPTVLSTTAVLTVPTLGAVTATTPACPAPKKGKKGAALAKKKKRKKKPRQLLSAGGFSSPVNTPGGAVPVYTEDHGPDTWRSTAVNATPATAPLSVTSQGICV